ncbi:MAG: ATP-binding protein [Syntrophomonadaceae bacterium]|jgi:cell division protease FtsH
MEKGFRLPNGYELGPSINISSLLYSGNGWQIYRASNNQSVLIVEDIVAKKWINTGLLAAELLDKLTIEGRDLMAICTEDQYQLVPIEKAKAPGNKTDALSFAVSLHETRKIDNASPLHDGIFLEKYSRLLPTWSLTARIDDEVILGKWMTGGVEISVLSFRRLCSLMGWLNPLHIKDILLAAGFEPAEVVDNVSEGQRNQSPNATGRIFCLPGRPQLEHFFDEHIIDIVLHPNRYEPLGITFPSAIILHGPTGSGKTFAAERLVEYLDWPSFSINSNTVGSPYIHDTSKKISQVFDNAIDSAPSVVIIDEMESFLSARTASGSGNLYHGEEVAEFLRRIPDAISKRVLVIGITNLLEMIDPAILRRGRFDHIIEIGMPSRQEVNEMIISIVENIPTEDNLDITPLLDLLTGRPLSDIAFYVREAARMAARDGKSVLDQSSILGIADRIKKDYGPTERKIGFITE